MMKKLGYIIPFVQEYLFLFLAATTAQEGHLFVCVCVHAYLRASLRACVRAFATHFKVSIEIVNCFDFLFLFFF